MKLKSIIPSATRCFSIVHTPVTTAVVAAACAAGLRQTIAIGLGVGKLKRVVDREVGKQLAPGAAIRGNRRSASRLPRIAAPGASCLPTSRSTTRQSLPTPGPIAIVWRKPAAKRPQRRGRDRGVHDRRNATGRARDDGFQLHGRQHGRGGRGESGAAVRARPGAPITGDNFQRVGGARMQEGVLSLMQMAKVAAAIALTRDAGVPLRFGDGTRRPGAWRRVRDAGRSEPRRTRRVIGFAGRVIEQTTSAAPRDFQRAGFLLPMVQWTRSYRGARCVQRWRLVRILADRGPGIRTSRVSVGLAAGAAVSGGRACSPESPLERRFSRSLPLQVTE